MQGFVATNSLTGTKTNTPLIETPQSVSIVTRDQIDVQNSGSTKDALRYTAGIDSTNRANFYSTDIMYSRGFILNRFVDGMKLQGDNATAMAPQEELYGIERVEVLRGPSSILYGQSSPGGIVNLVSKRPTATPFADLMLQGGSFDQKNVGFDLGGAVDKNKEFQVRLTGFLHDANNQVDFVKEQRAFIMPAFTWQPTKDTTFTVIAKYQHDPYAGLYNFVPYVGSVAPNPLGQVPTSFYAGDPSYNKLDRTQSSVTSLFEHRFDDVFTVRQNMRYQDMRGNLNQVLPFFMPDDTTLNRYVQTSSDSIKSFSMDNQLQANFATGPVKHTVLLGVDYQNTNFIDRLAQEFGPDINIYSPAYYQPIIGPSPDDPNVSLTDRINQNQRQLGFYFQDQIKIDRLVVLLGGREDIVKSNTVDRTVTFGFANDTVTNQNDNAFTKRIGAVYLFDSGFAPYALYATSFNPVLGAGASGQPFKPTTGTLYEAGIKYQPPGYNAFIQASVFDLKQQNVVTIDPNNPAFQSQTGEVESKGVEFEAKASVTKRLDLIASYSHANPVVTQSLNVDLGKIPVNVPRDTAAAWADYTFREGFLNGFGFGGGVRYIGQTYADQANTVVVPSYTVTDAMVHYDFGAVNPNLKGMSFRVNASNLFDTVYASQCTTLNLVGPYTNCVYGLRRQVVGTLRYRW